MRPFLFVIFVYVLITSCTNLDTAKPIHRNSFVHYYGGIGNYIANGAIELDDGFLLIGDSITSDNYGAVIIRTDMDGKTLWRKRIDKAEASAVISTPQGYYVLGDSINIDLLKTDVNTQIQRKLRLILLNNQGNVLKDVSWNERITTTTPNVKGTSITVDKSGNIITTSNVKYANISAYTQVISHDPNSLNIQWKNLYSQTDRNYQNSKSVLLTKQGNIIYATSAVSTAINSFISFIRILVKPNSNTPFINGGSFGQNYTDRFYSAVDIKSNQVGYGIIGTYKNFTGDKANIFFIRADIAGSPIEGSERYFDGVFTYKNNAFLNKSEIDYSLTQDEGIALANTSDGGFLLVGYTTSTTNTDEQFGNGGKDLFMIRIDLLGNVLWSKTFGGSGDEVPSTVTETKDGGFLISGTLTLANQNQMFILKTNSNGTLKN